MIVRSGVFIKSLMNIRTKRGAVELRQTPLLLNCFVKINFSLALFRDGNLNAVFRKFFSV